TDPRYTLGSNPAELDRLRRQAADLRRHSVALLEHVRLGSGGSALDLGCGPAGALELLAERVGPTGHVTGVDIDPAHVALARELTTRAMLANVDIREGDARRTGLPAGVFDLVHARLLLVNIPQPAEVMAEMVRVARPGGWVAGLEGELLGICYPPHPAWDRLCEVFLTVYRQDGANPHLGRRLPELFRQAGLVDIGVEARADVDPAGHPRRTILPDLVRSMRPKIVGRGLLEERELDELDGAVRQHLAASQTLALPYLYFLVWGRKPQ
ncbi:MAG: methyltransferase domain-containing protein, partial [Chloroflexi bacterium]|nr:methyltransferase domain-containing protein [Chloroflexota bacterium]